MVDQPPEESPRLQELAPEMRIPIQWMPVRAGLAYQRATNSFVMLAYNQLGLVYPCAVLRFSAGLQTFEPLHGTGIAMMEYAQLTDAGNDVLVITPDFGKMPPELVLTRFCGTHLTPHAAPPVRAPYLSTPVFLNGGDGRFVIGFSDKPGEEYFLLDTNTGACVRRYTGPAECQLRLDLASRGEPHTILGSVFQGEHEMMVSLDLGVDIKTLLTEADNLSTSTTTGQSFVHTVTPRELWVPPVDGQLMIQCGNGSHLFASAKRGLYDYHTRVNIHDARAPGFSVVAWWEPQTQANEACVLTLLWREPGLLVVVWDCEPPVEHWLSQLWVQPVPFAAAHRYRLVPGPFYDGVLAIAWLRWRVAKVNGGPAFLASRVALWERLPLELFEYVVELLWQAWMRDHLLPQWV